MEKDQNKRQTSDSNFPSQNVAVPDSSPPRSDEKSEDLIPLPSPVGLSMNSPARFSLDFDHITINPGNVSSKQNEKPPSPEKILPLVVVNRDAVMEPTENRVVLEESADIERLAVVEEPEAKLEICGGVVEPAGAGASGRSSRPQILQRTETENMVKKAALGFRVFGFLFCLVSLVVMAANINQGWALDSFYRYREFRYSMSANAIAFLYSGAQAVDLFYNLSTGKDILRRQYQLRHYFDFAIDQTIAYLLISASSSAATRVDDWQSNWGRDRFTEMATASICVSFFGFAAMAFSSLISGYVVCTPRSS